MFTKKSCWSLTRRVFNIDFLEKDASSEQIFLYKLCLWKVDSKGVNILELIDRCGGRPVGVVFARKGIFGLGNRFVGPRVKISLHVRKCLRSEDILGHENVSMVRWGQRSRTIKEGTTSDKNLVMHLGCGNFWYDNKRPTRNSQNDAVLCVRTPFDGCDGKVQIIASENDNRTVNGGEMKPSSSLLTRKASL